MKTVEQNKSGSAWSKEAVQLSASRLWWIRFEEKVKFCITSNAQPSSEVLCSIY